MVRSDARGRLDLAEMRAERESVYARPAGGRARPDWRKRALAEGRATVFTPAELRSMGFNRNVIIVVPYERTGRKVRGYRRGRSRSPTETWTVGAVEARKRRR